MKPTMLVLGCAILLAAVFGGCSTTTAKYSPSFENVNVLHTQSTGASKIASVVTSSERIATEWCRLSGPVILPNNTSYVHYLNDALRGELQVAGLYDTASPKRVVVELKTVALNTFIGNGSWTFQGIVQIGSEPPFPITATHTFDASYAAFQACSEAAVEFLPATQKFLNTLFNTPQFQAVLKR